MTIQELSARALPQLSGGVFLTDAGLETEMIFLRGFDLPCFASFVLLEHADGRAQLRDYFQGFLDLAADQGTGLVLEAPTWRASVDWGEQIGLSPDQIAAANHDAIAFLEEMRKSFKGAGAVVISGQIGPRGDGYAPELMMEPAEARAYHSHQIEALADTSADLITALTMTHTGEAIGIVKAAQAAGIPVVISFTVETDGRLPSGESLTEAIAATEQATDSAPAYYMINCAHPTHFEAVLEDLGPYAERVRGLRTNASTKSHAELDEATELDDGDPEALGMSHVRLRELLPQLTVIGGCCGTDLRHVRCMAKALLH